MIDSIEYNVVKAKEFVGDATDNVIKTVKIRENNIKVKN
jgi:hypothetical protein